MLKFSNHYREELGIIIMLLLPCCHMRETDQLVCCKMYRKAYIRFYFIAIVF